MPRHLYECPLRWADMDALGHVNNVTYVDYLQEARVDALRVHPRITGAEELAEGVVVVRHEVHYRAPLIFRRAPVLIELWVTDVRAASFTLDYEVFDELPEGRRVYLRARTVLTPYVFAGAHPRRITAAERAVLTKLADLSPDPGAQPRPLSPLLQLEEPASERRHSYRCPVRFSDMDAYRHVNNVKYFEYYQEARIDLLAALDAGEEPGSGLGLVVARIDVDYRAPMHLREDPYVVDSWVSRVGRSSFVIGAVIRDGGSALSASEAVMVIFDARQGRSVPLTTSQRELLDRSPSAS